MVFSYAVLTNQNYSIKSLTYIALVRISLLKANKPADEGEAWRGTSGKTNISPHCGEFQANTHNKTKPLLVRTTATTTSRLWKFM